jgi:integrase
MILTEALQVFLTSLKGVKSPETVAWYAKRLKPLVEQFGDRPIEAITIYDLRIWRAELASRVKRYSGHPYRQEEDGKLSPITVHGHVRASRRFFRWLVADGLLESSPAERLELPKKPRIIRDGLPEAHRDALIKAAADNPRDLAIALFLADTACRRGGVAGLNLQALDLRRRRAVVYEKGLGGSGKGRVVFFGRRTADALRTWLAIRPKWVKTDAVFLSWDHGRYIDKRLTGPGINQVMKRLGKKAGIQKGYNPHNWRHGCARGMTRRKAPLQSLSQLMGHSSVSVTADIYGTLDEDDLQQMHDECSWLGDE